MNRKQGEIPAGLDSASETLQPGVALAMLDLAERYWLARERARDVSMKDHEDIAA